MKELFYEIIKEASNGKVIIDNEIWNIGFNTIIYKNNKGIEEYYDDNNLSTLVIRNEEEFFKYLEFYLEKEMKIGRKNINFLNNTKKNQMKSLISYLFVNASTIDFVNPIDYLKRRIEFLDNDTFKQRSYINLKDTFMVSDAQQLCLKIDNILQDVRMETPYRLDFSVIDMSDGSNKLFRLPSISYGICRENDEEYCYIYGIQNHKQELVREEEKLFGKKISRLLYQINKGNIDEDVKDVTVSSVLSLTIFLDLLKRKNIEHVKGILYLPVRYLSREMSADNSELDEKKDMLLKRNDKIQNNVTNKFLRTIRRVVTQFDGIEIKNIDTVDDGYIELKINGKKYRTDNPLLDNVSKNILGR